MEVAEEENSESFLPCWYMLSDSLKWSKETHGNPLVRFLLEDWNGGSSFPGDAG